MLLNACVYVSNIKHMRLIEASLGVFMYCYANLPLVAPISLLCLWLLSTFTYYYMYFVIVDDDYKISSLHISQTVSWFATLLL